MSEVEVIMLKDTESCTVYTIQFLSESQNEFARFYQKFKDNARFSQDLMEITDSLEKIYQHGAIERFFRPEGKMNDVVCALPMWRSKLRLYCLRYSDKILVLGNGGEKKTATYEEDNELQGYVLTLQKFEKIIKYLIETEQVSVQKTDIDLDNKDK